ncbi:hypothetical protein MRB53_009077 [Persea americana]|uniref:Uncharacterized protein n=1 Tax=Persea americana TaxID=3435 RepID=A0ACC2LN59_PERAE|nr:hypothetical protein MRB53_009077 [Persea americana]
MPPNGLLFPTKILPIKASFVGNRSPIRFERRTKKRILVKDRKEEEEGENDSGSKVERMPRERGVVTVTVEIPARWRAEWRGFMVGTTWATRFLLAVAMLLFPTTIWAILVAGRKGEMLEETHDWAVGSLEREGMSPLAIVMEMVVLKAERMVGLVSKSLMWVMEV